MEANLTQDLAGDIAVVTGASGGLGAHFVKLLAARGAAVAITARRTELMAQICASRSSRFTITARDYIGTPVGIDARLVVELEVTPQITTGVLHARDGVGQIGAGILKAPMECFVAARDAYVERYGPVS